MGPSLYFFINLFIIFDVSNYRRVNNFTIDYSQGFSGINVDFRLSYLYDTSFNARLIFQTISSPDIKKIGITDVHYDIYRDSQHIWYKDLVFPEPIMYGIEFFSISNISLHDNISCIGTIDAQFNVSGIMQNERIEFILSMIMPVNPLEIKQVYLMNLIWAEFGLSILIGVLFIYLFRTIQILRREATYTEEEEKKDREFYDYLGDKLDEFKKD